MAPSFRERRTESIFPRERVKGPSEKVQRAAVRKRVILDASESLDDLRVPPGNRLEKLKGKRKGQYRIRVNDQWRVRFAWTCGDAFDVEMADYQASHMVKAEAYHPLSVEVVASPHGHVAPKGERRH